MQEGAARCKRARQDARGRDKSRPYETHPSRFRGPCPRTSRFGYTEAMTPLLLRRLAYAFLLAAYITYAVVVAPHSDPPGVSFLSLALGKGPARNPAVWGVFMLLGVVPLMYWALMVPDGRGQKPGPAWLWVWPFALGMMALGSFALLPYLILRRPYPDPLPGPRPLVVRWFGGRSFAGFVALALAFLLAYIVGQGNLSDYIYWFRHSAFVHLMTVDLLMLALLFPALLRDDMARRNVSPDEDTVGRVALALPLLGPALYLLWRPEERA